MKLEEALELAAQAWCMDKTQHLVMEPDLASEFAKILVREVSDLTGKLHAQEEATRAVRIESAVKDRLVTTFAGLAAGAPWDMSRGCPFCKALPATGHREGCVLDAALRIATGGPPEAQA